MYPIQYKTAVSNAASHPYQKQHHTSIKCSITPVSNPSHPYQIQHHTRIKSSITPASNAASHQYQIRHTRIKSSITPVSNAASHPYQITEAKHFIMCTHGYYYYYYFFLNWAVQGWERVGTLISPKTPASHNPPMELKKGERSDGAD